MIIPAAAQEERPQIPVGERKVPRKKDAGPRAVAVLRMTDKGKASLVPIAILIDGKFWDASAYKADPVPMALDPGTVYEAEQAGGSLGLFIVNAALHNNAANGQAPWIATGAWHPAGAEEPKAGLKAESAPVGIEMEDAPPRLTHDTSAAKAPPPASTPTSSGTPAKDTSKSGGASASGDEPPRLSKPAAPPSGSSPETKPGQGDAKPSGKPADDSEKIPASDSGTSEANRPRLRRGKPAESFADEEVPGYSRPGATPEATSAAGGKIVEAAAPSNVKLIPAISDAAGPPPHSFTFEWLKDEEGERRKQMVALAQQQVQAYVIAQDKARITPGHPQPSRRTAIKVKEPILDNVQMIAYDLWNSNQPIIVLSAQAHMPPPPPGSPQPAVPSDLQYSVLLVAYPDIYNNLHQLYSGVTDKLHLDITPRLELVDAVDADGDGRGELLFREISDAGSGWVIYRATGDKLWRMFDSLRTE